MKYIFKFVPLLDAVDLPRLNIESMNIYELEEHENQVMETINGVNSFILMAGHISANESNNAHRLYTKLKLHLSRVSDLIKIHKLAIAAQSGTMELIQNDPMTGLRKMSH